MERARPASYLHTGLDRYEVFDFHEDRLGKLKAFFERKDLPFSFHVPFLRPSYFPYVGVTTFFLHDDPGKRALSFKLINSTMHYANGQGSQNVKEMIRKQKLCIKNCLLNILRNICSYGYRFVYVR